MLALLSHLETPASHWFRYVDDTWLKLKSKDMLALTDFSLKTLRTDLAKLSPVIQMIIKITHILLFKNNVYMCLFLTYLKVQISQDA